MGVKEEGLAVFDLILEDLEMMVAKTETEHWTNKEGKRSVLTGIKLCIEKIKRKRDEH